LRQSLQVAEMRQRQFSRGCNRTDEELGKFISCIKLSFEIFCTFWIMFLQVESVILPPEQAVCPNDYKCVVDVRKYLIFTEIVRNDIIF